MLKTFTDVYRSQCINYHPLGNYITPMSDHPAVAPNIKHLAAINNIAFIKYEQGDKETAIQQWQQAIKINSQSAESLLALAVALYVKGEQQQAYQLAETALKLNKNFADFYVMKKHFWGQSMITDAQKMLSTAEMKSLLSQLP
ncbi:MAG: tetratricopeptide repeat protein [Cuspidothrix sp.]